MFPELEITDGWYRLKARIDAPMARAVERGIIRIGRKIGVAGARVSAVTFR
jgi:breast cancer 2 susceptibility protein